MADTGAKKGKKKKGKGKTLKLTEFLAGEENAIPSFPQVKKTDWADESEDLGDDDGYEARVQAQIDMSKLPTAPRASRGADIDTSKLPKSPPYTAFLGNLPYEVTDDEIRNFFTGLKIVNIRLIQEGGRQKGFGYAEFADLSSLVQALALNNEPMGNRKLRVDVAGNTGHSQPDGPRREESREEKVSDWRSRADEPPPPPGRVNGYSDGDRFSSRGDRGRDGDRGGFRRYDDRGPDRGHFGDRDRGGGRDGGFERGGRDGGFERGGRDGGFDRGGRARPSEADGVDCWRRAPEPAHRVEEDSAWRRDAPAWGRDDRRGGGGGGGRMPDMGRPADDSRSWRGGAGAGADANVGGGGGGRFDRDLDDGPRREPDPPRERKRLNLQPRSVPSDAPKKDEFSGSSIFGGARPVDTAAKEREIEARLAKTTGPPEATSPTSTTWNRDSSRPYVPPAEEPEDRGDDVWRDEGTKKDRTRVMRPDLLSEEERSPRVRTVSTGSDRSGDDLDDRPGRVILRKSLSRESKDDEDGVAPSREGRARSGSGSRGRGSSRGAVRGRGNSPGKGGHVQKKEKPTDIGKYEEPPPPVFSKQSMYSVLAADDEAEDEDSENEPEAS